MIFQLYDWWFLLPTLFFSRPFFYLVAIFLNLTDLIRVPLTIIRLQLVSYWAVPFSPRVWPVLISYERGLTLIALILGIAYTYSQDNKGKKVSFFVVTFNVIWLPWAMLLMTFVMGGPDAASKQATGLLAAHLYDFLTRLYPTFGGGRNFIRTPAIVKRWFGADKPGFRARGYGSAVRPATEARGRGSSSGFGFSSAWGSRGQGQRLGGD